jgi:hypothetical protein
MMQIDLELANVRAFVVAAHELHFGRAAGKLCLSQQGLPSGSAGSGPTSASRGSSARPGP